MMRPAVQPGRSVYNTQRPMPQPQTPAYGLTGAYAALQRNPGAPANTNTVTNYMAPVMAGNNPAISGNRDLAMTTAQGGIDGLDRFVQPGVQGTRLAAALSGSLGNEEMAAAMADFQESPQQKFLRERGEQAVLRNAAATGGTRGGNVLKELTQFGIGAAAQDFDKYFDRVSGVADRGLNAASLQNPLIQTQANAATQAGGQEVSLAGSRLASQTSRGNAMLNADLTRDRDAARYAFDAGNSIAGNEDRTTSALSALIDQQGQGINSYSGQGVGNLANLLTGAGRDQYTSSSNLANLLATIATGTSAQVGGLPGIPGVNQTNGILGGIGNLLGGVGSAASGYASLTKPPEGG